MKVFINKKILKKGLISYSIEKIEYCCEGMKSLLSSNFVSIINGENEEDVNNFVLDKDFDKNFLVALVSSHFEDDGDYNYDETEWIPYYNEYNTYYKILKCPICGEDIEFVFRETDMSKQYQKILDKFPKNKKTKANKELIKQLNKVLEVLTKGDFYCEYQKEPKY